MAAEIQDAPQFKENVDLGLTRNLVQK